MTNPKWPKWVGQDDRMGCGVAVLAMLTGRTYRQVARQFSKTQLTRRGIKPVELDAYLASYGYAVSRRYDFLHRKSPRGFRRPRSWLCFARVRPDRSSLCAHYVVLLRDGTVLDPGMATRSRLSWYYRVWEVVDVVKIG